MQHPSFQYQFMQEPEGRNTFSVFHRPNKNKRRSIGFQRESKMVADVKISSKQRLCKNEIIIICYIGDTVISSALRRVSSGRSGAKYLLIF